MAVRRSNPGFRVPTGVVRAVLVALLVLFVGFAVGIRLSPALDELYRALMLDPAAIVRGERLYTPLTYWALHSLREPQHLLFNGLGLYFFASDLEELWGSKRIAAFMLAGALGGALVVVLTALLGLHAAPVVGASGIVTACVVAWGLTFQDRELLFFFFRMRGITLVWVTLAIELLGAVSLADGVSSSAHFGGMAVGAAYVLTRGGAVRRAWLRFRLRRLDAQARALSSSESAARRPHLRVVRGGAEGTSRDKRTLN